MAHQPSQPIDFDFATSALPKIQRKKKEKGSKYDMKSLSPAFSPNWMAGSVLTTTNPVMTTNPAITPVRSGPYKDCDRKS